MLDKIQAGDEGLKVQLEPEIVVSGRISGDLNQLPGWSRKRIAYRNPLPSNNHGLWTDLDVRDGVAHFRISNLLAGQPLRVFPGEQTLKFDVEKSVTDLEIDLDAPAQDVSEATVEHRQPQEPLRLVIVKLTGIQPDAPVSGEIQLSYRRRDGRHTSEMFPVDPDGRVKVALEVPTRLSVRGRNLLGYWARKADSVDVAESDKPLEIELPVIPAGAIRGVVYDADGSLCPEFSIRMQVIEMPLGLDDHMRHAVTSITPKKSRGEFLYTSLPVGGRYEFVVRKSARNSLAATRIEPFVLKPESPVRKFELRFRDEPDYSVRIADESGETLPGAGVRVTHTMNWAMAQSGGAKWVSSTTFAYRADDSGTVHLLDPRPDKPHQYSLQFYAPGHVGAVHKVSNWNQLPKEIRLKPGNRLSVTLLHAETGEPLANLHSYTLAETWGFHDRSWPSGRTDESGNLNFDTLEQIEHSLRIPRAILKSLEVTEGEESAARLHSDFPADSDTPNEGGPWIRFVAGQATAITVRAVPKP